MINISRRNLAAYAVDQLLAGGSPARLARRLAATLAVNKGGDETDLLLDDVLEIFEERGKLARATLTSATALNDKLRQEVKDLVRSSAKVDDVILVENIDPACIGGIKIETAKKSWDKTVVRKLADIKGGI